VLEQSRNVLLIATEAIERFGDDYIELPSAGILQKALIACSQVAGPALRAIGVCRDKLPGIARDTFSAEADLVLDRGIALQI
jgi:hypothetical protein